MMYKDWGSIYLYIHIYDVSVTPFVEGKPGDNKCIDGGIQMSLLILLLTTLLALDILA